MKITKVYTKGGDKGMTSLVGGVRINKADVRLEAYGTVDELGAQLGLLAAYMSDGPDKDMVERVQGNLFIVGAIWPPTKVRHLFMTRPDFLRARQNFWRRRLTG